MKLLLVVLDGAGDRGKHTPLEMSKTPTFDMLAKTGQVGLLDIGYKTHVNSDFGYLNLLGCYSKETYPGRGYLEALGIGARPNEEDVCIRGNFATLDQKGMLKDRRAGRDETGLKSFCDKLDGTEIDGIHFSVKKSAGHRVVLILKGRNLSDKIIPNDPEETGVSLPQVKPREPKAKFTASVLNKFVSRAHKTLSKEPINKKRKLPANIILIRNPGRKNTVPSFKTRYGLKGTCVAGIPIAKGVSRYLGLDVTEVPGATGMPDTNLKGKINATMKALKKYDFVFLHINGTDILSHDAKRKEKTEFIEKIDMEIGRLSLKDIVTIVTCDHRTESEPGFKAYRHLKDPVPVLVAGNSIKPSRVNLFSEKECEKGFRIEGNSLITFVLKETKK